ncbi:hypothetical protein Tco_0988984 [Tanacetum coccineum]|uniref:Uncharacterized protein n=1 Tax=Tanacetum coccineum TaxID=301880 RepID=A0ABQ5ESP8_9ASTR
MPYCIFCTNYQLLCRRPDHDQNSDIKAQVSRGAPEAALDLSRLALHFQNVRADRLPFFLLARMKISRRSMKKLHALLLRQTEFYSFSMSLDGDFQFYLDLWLPGHEHESRISTLIFIQAIRACNDFWSKLCCDLLELQEQEEVAA